MNRCFYLIAAIAIAIATTLITSYGQDDDFKPPGSEEAAAVDRANGVLDKVYGELMSKLDDEQEKKSLKEAQRAWIKWRDAEAEFIGRLGGSVGGSALRVDYLVAEEKLIQDRTNVLEKYVTEAANNR
jgi:uncharacterized protein YecT (DUF1311 family)